MLVSGEEISGVKDSTRLFYNGGPAESCARVSHFLTSLNFILVMTVDFFVWLIRITRQNNWCTGYFLLV